MINSFKNYYSTDRQRDRGWSQPYSTLLCIIGYGGTSLAILYSRSYIDYRLITHFFCPIFYFQFALFPKTYNNIGKDNIWVPNWSVQSKWNVSSLSFLHAKNAVNGKESANTENNRRRATIVKRNTHDIISVPLVICSVYLRDSVCDTCSGKEGFYKLNTLLSPFISPRLPCQNKYFPVKVHTAPLRNAVYFQSEFNFSISVFLLKYVKGICHSF